MAKHFALASTCIAALCLAACSQPNTTSVETAVEPVEETRPNILLIVADDLGYTDLGVYGGEISTPNLDQLARDGLILTDFHNQAVCSPTRASLLSGMENHNAGGGMHVYEDQRGTPGYQGGLIRDVVALPAILQTAGYFNVFAGKWHLGHEADRLPNARGFDQSFILQQGGASHYHDMRGMFEFQRKGIYWQNDQLVEALPEDFYSSNFYTDFVIDSLKDNEESGAPWFAELAFTAPHWPLHAPQEYIDKYIGRYDSGYEALRTERIERAKSLGVIPQEAKAYPRLDIVAPWDSLSEEEKAISSREMEIYAGMVELLDENVGRMIDYLKASGQYENTYIVFMSDNGAEGQNRDPGDNGDDWTFDNSLENMGLINSHTYYGPEWAQAGVGVMRYHKSLSSEGGTRGPAFVHSPMLSKKGVVSDAFASVIDVAPTVLDLAGIDAPETVNGQTVQDFQGRSMSSLLIGDADAHYPTDFTFGWEVFGHRAIRKGDWKLLWLAPRPAEANQVVPMEAGVWGLYNMATDPGETTDLSNAHPEVVADLLAEWEVYITENQVIVPEEMIPARPL